MKRTARIFCLLVFVTSTLISELSDSPKLTGAYLGQKPPGLIPEIFAPGIVSRGYFERSVVFSPAQDELFFQLRCLGFTSVIIQMKQNGGIWSEPEVACYSGVPEYSDDAPFFAPDGKQLFINSDRPLPGSKEIKKDSDIWIIQKDSTSWEEPTHAGTILNSSFNEFYPTVSKMNNLYFSSNRKVTNETDYDIFVSHYSGNGFSEPVMLDSAISTGYFEGHPFIAPDESYLIFSSDRPGELGAADLYISFKGENDKWQTPINMGNEINSPFHEAAPYVSPDGKFLFFCSFRPNPPDYRNHRLTLSEIKNLLDGPGNGSGDIYWVSAKIIEQLRPKK